MEHRTESATGQRADGATERTTERTAERTTDGVQQGTKRCGRVTRSYTRTEQSNLPGRSTRAHGASWRESVGSTALDNRQRIGANMAICSDARRVYFLLSQQLFRSTFGRLPRDLIRIIVYYYKQIAQSCIHVFLPCPVCKRRRCAYCGVRFYTSGGDPRPCRCPLPTRTSARLLLTRFLKSLF